ncbi:MAG TPA: DUF3052 domain-containing protein [Frankiaceae bacterium]|jgi:hypothetical protein|nr:DUF3052 domain-containing protein [Frankiaceae bacterium]
MAGYSPAPLAQKLGIKPHSRLLLTRAPADFSIPDLPEGVTAKHRPAKDPYDTILLFAVTQAELTRSFPSHAERLTVAGGMWVCWPKKASGLQRDLTETQVRAIGLDAGLVDVKVCAVDETWSGLRFVRRLADR